MSPPRRSSRKVRERSSEYLAASARSLLLDTHVWLWWNAGDRRLGKRARSAIQAAQEVYFSVASAWEIALKVELGKLELPENGDIVTELAQDGFRPLSIELKHVLRVATLPRIHRDPFDRLLVCQAREDNLTLLTADPVFSRYDVPVRSALE